MSVRQEGGRWRLILGTIAFAAWAPPSLVGLPLAGLLLAARPRSAAERGAALAVGLSSAGLLLVRAGDLLTGFVHAYIVLVAAAFATLTVFARPGQSFLRHGVRASLAAGLAAMVLARLDLGSSAWDALHWAATRDVSAAMRFVVEIQPAI